MSQAERQSRASHPIGTPSSAVRLNGSALIRLDPDGLRYVATVLVWAHWFVVAFVIVQLAYRPVGWPELYVVYVPLVLLLVAFNGYTHYRLANKAITQRWIVALALMDVTLVSGATIAGGGFSHYFLYLLYYPPLAGYALVFTSFRLTMVCVTIVALLYLAISLLVGDGIDTGASDEKPLMARIFVMYAVAASVNLIAGFERSRWRAATEREQALQRERIELSQAVHDTTAQSAYLIGLGIDAARQLAGDSNEELNARLEATSLLSKTAIWQLRHPIDMGRIFDGRELGRTLDSHAGTFTSVTSVVAELTQTGVEPPLSIEAKSLLFTIAHNALTNAFRHAEASRVRINLDFGRHELTLSVSDDGQGLPADYEDRGHGFANMRTRAGRLGGRLLVEPNGPDGGAAVSCVVPFG